MSEAQTTLDDLSERLRAAGGEAQSATTAKTVAIRRRNDLIRQAVDGGMAQKVVANLVGVRPPHIVRILGEA